MRSQAYTTASSDEMSNHRVDTNFAYTTGPLRCVYGNNGTLQAAYVHEGALLYRRLNDA